MKEFKLGFIGAGNMAAAIIKGAVQKKVIPASAIKVFDVDEKKAFALANELGSETAMSLEDLCENSEMLVIAVKPNVMAAVLGEIKPCIQNKAIVSIAAGWSAEKIKQIIGDDKKVLRLMPNTPLLAGEGMTVFEMPCSLTDDEIAFVKSLFSALGQIDEVPCKMMDAVTAVSGSGPAYVFMFIEAIADAGVLCGLPRDKALKLAAQTVLGSAKMVLDTGSHPGALKDAVCSPGGTTIEAVKVLEQNGLRGSVISAVEKCAEKSHNMSGK